MKSSALLLALALWAPAHAEKKSKAEPSPLDAYIQEAAGRGGAQGGATAGSLWNAASPFSDLARDLRASQVDDLVTILVAERASATSKGLTNTSRKSDAKSSVGALFGATRAAGPWANLAGAGSDAQLQAQGATSRESVLTTTLAARVTHVLPNGYLVVEGVKDILVNSERQLITVRGVVRPADLSSGNIVRSDRLAQLEVRINGKGVVGDAIRRPFILYRLLMGLLPF
jgi:flagellar L-ring protein precursor FlgH